MRLALVMSWLLLIIAPLAVAAAPLFPTEPDKEWARDAVAVLAAKGLIEGYPGGNFKGDRFASRWELALTVSRLLSAIESGQVRLLTRDELEGLRRLTEDLGEELVALGVRVALLSDEMTSVEQRVKELERLTFYGDLEVRIGGQSFSNDGSGGIGPNQEFLNFHEAVGTAAGASGPLPASTSLPGIWGLTSHGVLPVSDFERGRPLTSGTLFTTRATLGLKAIINQDYDAGMEFKAYSSLGDAIVDAYYGVKAPYLSNQFAGTTGLVNAGAQPLNNSPFTRMTLDNFWIRHKPSRTSARFGWFPDTDFSASTYHSQRSPSDYHFTTPFVSGEDSGRLGSYGLQLKGEVPLNSDTLFRWEGITTRLPDGNVDPLGGDSYVSRAEGVNLALLFHEKRGSLRLNFLHAANKNNGGANPGVGRIIEPVFGLQWVNPDGFFHSQLGQLPGGTAGIGSSTDVRPVPGFGFTNTDGINGIPGLPNFGGVGPQQQVTYSAALDYTFDHALKPHLFFEYAHSDYRPSQNSSFTIGGEALRAGLDLQFLDGGLDWHAEYVSTDATFSPFLLQYPRIGNIPISSPYFDEFPLLYSLHDAGTFQNNRKGIRTNIDFYPSERTQLGVSYGHLSQVVSSAPDIRFSAGSLGFQTPNTTVLGFTPGTKEAFYSALSPHTFVADGNGNAVGQALEAPRGRSTEFSLYGSHEWLFEPTTERGLTASGLYFNYNFFRDSQLAKLRPDGRGVQGENENFQDLTAAGFLLRLDYDLTKDVSIHTSWTEIGVSGHYDPTGVYSPYAEAVGSARFTNVNTTQSIPELGFDWKVSDKVSWGMIGRHYKVRDEIPDFTVVSVRDQTQNLVFAPTSGAHPFNWSGWQMQSTFSVSF